MKTIIRVAVVIVTFCLTSNAQINPIISSTIRESFSNEFKGAIEVQWERISKDVLLARFNLLDENLIAYFDKEGALLRYGRKISFEKTPWIVQNSISNLKKGFENKSGPIFITHIYQLHEGGLVSYYTNMGNANLFLAVLTTNGGRNKVLRNVKLNLRKLDQQPAIVSKD